jgi:hypothetical protein
MLTTKLTLGLAILLSGMFYFSTQAFNQKDYLAAKNRSEKDCLGKKKPKAKKFMLISACNAILRAEREILKLPPLDGSDWLIKKKPKVFM